MKNIILCPNVTRDSGLEATRAVAGILEKHGREAVVCPIFDDAEEPVSLPGFKMSELEAELSDAEMVITFGGDGTILRVARNCAELSVPILGVNMGGKGFMAELERDDIELIALAATGRYTLDSRMMLDVELVRDGETAVEDFALNDVVIGGLNKVIDLTIYGDGHRISRFTGDGAIVATPTGSTAYSMSAGGPIVEPSAQNIIITPICAHVLEAKPYVLVSDRCVTVEIGYLKSNPAYISVDGCDYTPVFSGDTVTVRKSGRHTKLVQISGRSFYSRVSDKLGEEL